MCCPVFLGKKEENIYNCHLKFLAKGITMSNLRAILHSMVLAFPKNTKLLRNGDLDFGGPVGFSDSRGLLEHQLFLP